MVVFFLSSRLFTSFQMFLELDITPLGMSLELGKTAEGRFVQETEGGLVLSTSEIYMFLMTKKETLFLSPFLISFFKAPIPTFGH